MAIYHLHKRNISSAENKSVVAKSDYVAREKSYSNDSAEVLHKESGNMPTWANDARDFWAAAEEHERKNARLGCELEVALPRELSLNQQIKLVRDFVKDRLSDKPYQWAIHKGKGVNPHAHIVYSERCIGQGSFERDVFFKRNGAKKDRSMNDIEWLSKTRERWANLANEHLREAGRIETISHRSLKDQADQKMKTALATKNKSYAEILMKEAEALNREPKNKAYWWQGSQRGYARKTPWKPFSEAIVQAKKSLLEKWEAIEQSDFVNRLLVAKQWIVKKNIYEAEKREAQTAALAAQREAAKQAAISRPKPQQQPQRRSFGMGM